MWGFPTGQRARGPLATRREIPGQKPQSENERLKTLNILASNSLMWILSFQKEEPPFRNSLYIHHRQCTEAYPRCWFPQTLRPAGGYATSTTYWHIYRAFSPLMYTPVRPSSPRTTMQTPWKLHHHLLLIWLMIASSVKLLQWTLIQISSHTRQTGGNQPLSRARRHY